MSAADHPALKRILYVEDDDAIRAVGQMALETVGGFEVVACASGAEALMKAQAAKPDLMLLDVRMPEMDGPQTLAALRALPGLAHTPVVFLTALVQHEATVRLRALGAADVLAKPFNAMTLSDKLQEIWGRSAS